MNKMKILCALLLIVTVSACSSGGGGGSSKAKSDDPGGGGGPVVPFTLPEVLSDAPGINSDPVETTNTLLSIEAAFAELKRAIALPSTDVGSLAAGAPTGGAATLKGYIRIPGKVTGEIIVGNLEIKATFGDSSVLIDATDLAEFDISGPAGPVPLTGTNVIDPNRGANKLQGSGTITGTTIESNSGGFGGNLFNQAVNYQVSVDAHWRGGLYEDGDTIVTYGTVTGTTTTSTGTSNAFTDGEFAASGDSPSDSE